MTKILTSDLLISDVITRVDYDRDGHKIHNGSLEQVLDEMYKKLDPETGGLMHKGGKYTINKEDFQKFEQAIEGHDYDLRAGGSSANFLTTLKKLLPKEVDIDFLGVAGNDYNDKHTATIRNSLKGTIGPDLLHVIEDGFPKDSKLEPAISFVIVEPNGERTIFTYPGNAKDIIKPEMITEDMVKNADVLVMQGSQWEKMAPSVADRMVALRLQAGKEDKKRLQNGGHELWLALPTHAKFGQDNAERFKYLIPSANVVLGNVEELLNIYQIHQSNGDQDKTHQALLALQKDFKQEYLKKASEEKNKNDRWHGSINQVGLITLGEKGAALITKDRIHYIAAANVAKEDIVNKLGAGDTAYAGFAAAYLKHPVSSLNQFQPTNYEYAARTAMELAGQKLKQDGPRLENPLKALINAGSLVAKQWYNTAMEPSVQVGA